VQDAEQVMGWMVMQKIHVAAAPSPAHCVHGRFDELHPIVDGEACSNLSSWTIDHHLDWLARVLHFQKHELKKKGETVLE
jgi:hypothetical protein